MNVYGEGQIVYVSTLVEPPYSSEMALEIMYNKLQV